MVANNSDESHRKFCKKITLDKSPSKYNITLTHVFSAIYRENPLHL